MSEAISRNTTIIGENIEMKNLHDNHRKNSQLVVQSGLRAGQEADVEFECYGIDNRNPINVTGYYCAPLHGGDSLERRNVSLRVLV